MLFVFAAIVVVKFGVVVNPVVAAGVGVDDRRRQAGHVVDESVAGVLGDAVGGGEGQVAVDADLGLGVEPMADPAEAPILMPWARSSTSCLASFVPR